MTDTSVLEKNSTCLSVYARLAKAEILRQEGVVRMARRTWRKWRRTSGVCARVDGVGVLHIDAAIVIRYGCNVRELVPRVQCAILDALQRVSDRPIGQVNVMVEGIKYSRRFIQRTKE